MPATLIVGAQWGDEGKGKIVDFLAESSDAVVRGQGGSNAGHTVNNHLGEFKLHAVPSGIFHDGVKCVMGPGTVVNPDAVQEELAELEERRVDVAGLLLSDRAHMVMPYHLDQEGLEEELQGARAIGTTRRGIGPAYADKHARFGLRLGDLLEPEWLLERISLVLAVKNRQLAGFGRGPYAADTILRLCESWASVLGGRIEDTTAVLASVLDAGGRVIVEGQLGAMRDLDHGIYPFVTSSAPCAAGVCQGAGVPPSKVERTVGVVKAYSTSVGAGPMVCELEDEMGEKLRELGHEYGASTGRPRRCGWLDLPALRTSAQLNGYTGIAITRLDVLDTLPELQVCTHYELDGERIDFAPSTHKQERARPVYETVPGWSADTTECRKLDELPKNARAYVDRIAETMAATVDIVSIGPGREQTIVVTP